MSTGRARNEHQKTSSTGSSYTGQQIPQKNQGRRTGSHWKSAKKYATSDPCAGDGPLLLSLLHGRISQMLSKRSASRANSLLASALSPKGSLPRPIGTIRDHRGLLGTTGVYQALLVVHVYMHKYAYTYINMYTNTFVYIYIYTHRFIYRKYCCLDV